MCVITLGMLFVIPLFLLVGVARSDTQANKLVDSFLSDAQEEVRQLIAAELAELPDLEKTWTRHLWPFRLGGRLVCNRGRVTRIGRFQRIGDVRITWDWSSVVFLASLRFDDMRLSYPQCELKFGVLRSSNSVTLKATNVSVQVSLSMSRRRGRCVSYIEQLQVTRFGSLAADMGRSLMGRLKGALVGYFIGRNQRAIISRLNDNLEGVSVTADFLTNQCQQLFETPVI